MGTIGKNIRKLRDEQSATQQQLAEAVGVSYQAVSKWENSITEPDVSVIPEIAAFFEVKIDDLFAPDMKAYRNKADRLLSVYESDISDTNAYEKAEVELSKLILDEKADSSDISNYAYLNDLRSRYHIQAAEKNYTRAILMLSVEKGESYYKLQRQFIRFMARQGKAGENVRKHLKILEAEPDNIQNHILLVCAYQEAGDFENSLLVTKKAIRKFSDNAMLMVLAGDSCTEMGKDEKAIEYWEKAYEMDGEMIDAKYSLFRYYKKSGLINEAVRTLEFIRDWNAARGYDVENRWIYSELNKITK